MVEIEFTDAAFTYDGKTNALDGVSLAIEQGEFVCIVGGNGSGKSTLAKHMNALLVPDSGSVSVRGVSTGDARGAAHARQVVGMVFQNPDDALVATLVKDDVAFGPRNLGLPADEVAQRVKQSIAEVGLVGLENHDTIALSGGQKQRVAIAGVLAMRPSVLVLDEATAMLDPAGKADILDVIKSLHNQGMTIVHITHAMEEVAQVATRAIALDRGKVAFDGAPSALLNDTNLLRQLNLRAPYATRLIAALRERGIPVDSPLSATPEELAATIQTAIQAR